MTVEERERENEGDAGIFDSFATSRTSSWPGIPHYYGNVSRQLMLGGAALMLVASPLYGNNLRLELPFEVVGTLVIVGLAALTSPKSWIVLLGDAVASGIGAAVFGTWAIFEYDNINPVAFMLRSVIAIIFLFAFYFSMKTLRAFTLHQIGKRETIDEFEEQSVKEEEEMLERERILKAREGSDR